MQIYVKHTSFQFSKHEKQRINANIQFISAFKRRYANDQYNIICETHFIPVFKIRNANDQYKFM